LGGDAVAVVSGEGRSYDIPSGEDVTVVLDLGHLDQPRAGFTGRESGAGDLGRFRAEQVLAFVASNLSGSTEGHAEAYAAVTAGAKVREEVVGNVTVWTYELPEYRGVSRVVATVQPRIEVDEAGKPRIDARFNVSHRLQQLRQALTW